MENLVEDYEVWSNRMLAQQLMTELQIMKNRKETGDPLKSYEVFVQISREHYETLCKLALESLRRHAIDTQGNKLDVAIV